MKKTIPNDATTVVRIPYQLKKLIAQYAKSDNMKPSKFIRDLIAKEINRLELSQGQNEDYLIL
jgi:hypothetical protein